jgi:DNA-binding NtrC family response regulator
MQGQLLQDQGRTLLDQSHSSTMRDILRNAEHVAQTDLQVLIAGEQGIGKEWLARRIHLLSKRAGQPLLEFPCDVIRSHRLEQELMGREERRTGGTRKIGGLERTGNGTLFFRHVSDLPLDFQATVVRALETRQFTPLGKKGHPLPFRGRVMASLTGNPRAQHEEGTLGPDLYRYFSAVILNIPPLRDRREDIPALIDRIIFECNGLHGTRVKGIDQDALLACARYAWPGNIRELRNAVRYACLLSLDKMITMNHLPPFLRHLPHEIQHVPSLMSVAKAEQYLIEKALNRAATKKQAAKLLGISLKTLYNKINKYALQERFLNPVKTGDTGDE